MTGLPHIVLGGGGHARVVIRALQRLGANIAGFTEIDPGAAAQAAAGVPFLGADEILESRDSSQVLLVNGIGSVGDTTLRQAVYRRWRARGFRFAVVVHPQAFCETDVELGDGVQVMAGAVLQTGCRIGANTIVNSSASIDHDCEIGAHCHVAPGVVLSGGVKVGDGVHIGTGAVVVQGIAIGAGALVRAGSVVTKNVAAGETFREPDRDRA